MESISSHGIHPLAEYTMIIPMDKSMVFNSIVPSVQTILKGWGELSHGIHPMALVWKRSMDSSHGLNIEHGIYPLVK